MDCRSASFLLCLSVLEGFILLTASPLFFRLNHERHALFYSVLDRCSKIVRHLSVRPCNTDQNSDASYSFKAFMIWNASLERDGEILSDFFFSKFEVTIFFIQFFEEEKMEPLIPMYVLLRVWSYLIMQYDIKIQFGRHYPIDYFLRNSNFECLGIRTLKKLNVVTRSVLKLTSYIMLYVIEKVKVFWSTQINFFRILKL